MRRVRQGDITMIGINDFTTLTFDCYGTLIDWERGILAELRPWAARHGIRADDDTLLTAFGEAEVSCEAATPGKLYPAILGDVLAELAERWNASLEPQEAATF